MAVRDRVVLVHVSHSPRLVDGDPPRFLELVAHPVRWRLLRELVYSDRAVWVLFLCTGNSARSQIAEGLLEQMSEGRIEAVSAGSHPKPLHRNAVRVMKRRGIDISANRTKHLDEFVAQRFDFVITLCDRVREVCPEFPSHPSLVHWSVPDPALEGPNARASYPAFERTATELETRIGFLLHLLDQPSTTRRLTHAER